MSVTLAIVSPTGIDRLAGTTLASLGNLPPGGLALTYGGAGTSVSVTLDSTATLSASSAAGATVSGSGGTLTITGSLAEVNTALASLALADTTAGSTSCKADECL